MKKLLLASTLAIFSLSSFAQIDDVVNKKSTAKRSDPSFSGEMFKTFFNRITSIDIGMIVDEMNKDGVKERQYGAVIGADGRIIDANIWDDSYNMSRVLPFTVKITTDKKVYLAASLIDFGNLGDATINNVPVFTKAQVGVFKLDDGVTFKDVKSIGWRFADVDARIAVSGRNSDQYLAFIVGAEIGGTQETIMLDNGQKIVLNGGPGYDKGSENALATQFNMRGGLELKDKLGAGSITLRGLVDYRTVQGGISGTELSTSRQTLIVSPSLGVTQPLGKKTSATLSVGMNIGIVDRVVRKDKEQNGYDINKTQIYDLGLRNRQPFTASLKINF